MPASERNNGNSLPRRRARSTSPPSVALRTRVQTSDELQQFQAAFRLFLVQMARQMLDSMEKKI